MRDELEQKLYNEFPHLFAGRSLPITQNLMAFGCECDDGWFNLIYDLCKSVSDTSMFFTQIKEKYGGLRAYHMFSPVDPLINKKILWIIPVSILKFKILGFCPYDFYQRIVLKRMYDKVEKLVDRAEKKSYHVCEICGDEAILCCKHGWLKTLCSECKELNGYSEYIEVKNEHIRARFGSKIRRYLS